MRDLIGQNLLVHNKIIDVFKLLASRFNFKPISTPIMEFSDVFTRSLGNASDVVMKEMYTFKDRNDESLTLRPEGTAGVARAVISNGLTQDLPQKLFYYGPMFRYERPQKGRLRQFHQIGVETFANTSFYRDFEVLMLAQQILKKLNILDSLTLQINNLGDNATRNLYKKKLQTYYSQNRNKLSSDSLVRLESNPLRILDSKSAADIEINKNAPIITKYLSKASKHQFLNLKNMLKQFNINFVVNPFLVRGLDYYSNTIFEFTLIKDSRYAVLAGGSYNNLVSSLGGPDLHGIGWAAGIERLTSLVKFNSIAIKKILVLPLEIALLEKAIHVRKILIEANFISDIYNAKNLKKALKYANKIKADFVIVLGEQEIKKGLFLVRNLDTGRQDQVSESNLLEYIENDKKS